MTFPTAKWTIEEDKASQQIGQVTRTHHANSEMLGEVFNIDGFSQRLVASGQIRSFPLRRQISNVVVSETPSSQGTESQMSVRSPLAEQWSIGLDTAKQTNDHRTSREMGNTTTLTTIQSRSNLLRILTSGDLVLEYR